MSQSRKDLIAQYDIQEPELKALLDDLCTKPEDANNLVIIKKALRGIYSDFGSPLDDPNTTLIHHLQIAGYADLVKKAINGDYDYNYGPKPSASHPDFAAASKLRDNQEQEMMKSVYLFLAPQKAEADTEKNAAPASPKI